MQPMEDDIDADTETVEQMTAGLIKHIFGKAETGIRDQLRGAQDIPKEIGSLAFTLVDAGADQAEKAGLEFDLDMLMGVATEVIDSLLQLAEAMGLIESADDDELREESLMRAVEAYLMTGSPSPEEAEAAKMALAQMAEAGAVGVAAEQIERMGKSRGEDPFAEPMPLPANDPAPAPVDAAPGAGQPPDAGRPRAPLMQE